MIRWVIVALLLAGCAAQTENQTQRLLRQQHEIQNCILSGGHAHPDLDGTILCAY